MQTLFTIQDETTDFKADLTKENITGIILEIARENSTEPMAFTLAMLACEEGIVFVEHHTTSIIRQYRLVIRKLFSSSSACAFGQGRQEINWTTCLLIVHLDSRLHSQR